MYSLVFIEVNPDVTLARVVSLLPRPRPLIIRRMPHVLGLYLTPNGFAIFTITKKILKKSKKNFKKFI
jgi:hypothetical protein